MSGFAPSVEAAQRVLGAGAKIVSAPHPGGVKGIKFSLEEVARRAWRARNDPRLVAWAGRALMHRVGCPYVKSQKNACVCGGMDRPKGVAAQTQKLLEQFRAQTIYTQDGVGTERMSQPVETLCLDENGLCMPARDCDDGVVALTGATLGIGIGSCIIGQAFDASGIPVHVISGVYDPERGLLRADPSDDKWPVGQSAPGVTSEKIVKLNENPSVNLSGSNDSGDFIGIGAIQAVGRALGQIDPTPPEQGGLINEGNQCPPGSYYDPTSGACIGAVASGSGSSGFVPGQQVTGPVPIQPLPAGNWDAVPDFGIQTGLRYVIGALFPPSHDTAPMLIPTPWGLVTIPGDSAPWTEQDVRTVFQGDFTIEKVWPGNVSNSWLLQGIAQRTMSPYAGNVRKTDQGQPVVNVLEVFREHVAAPQPSGGGGIPGVSAKWMPWVVGAAALAAAAGAVYWYKTAHATPELSPVRRRNPLPGPVESFRHRGVPVNVYKNVYGWMACFGTVKGDSGECWPGSSRDSAVRKAIERLNRRIDVER